MAAMVSANALGAEALGMADQIGSISPGLQADIIALDGDPLKVIRAVRRVVFVMKGGMVYKNAARRDSCLCGRPALMRPLRNVFCRATWTVSRECLALPYPSLPEGLLAPDAAAQNFLSKRNRKMKRITFSVLYALWVTALLLGAVQSNPSLAQTPTTTPQAAPPSQWLTITQVSVKPEMMGEFQNFMKNTTNPALKKGGVKWREVWQSTNFSGDAFEFVLVSQFDKFADFDGPSPLEKALGAQGFADWSAKAGSLVKSVHRYIVRTRPDLSVMSKAYAPKLAVISSVHVAVGRNQEFEDFTKNDLVPVMAKSGATYLVSQTIFGGDANEYVTLTMRDAFAEIDKGPVPVQVLGPEGAVKLFQKLPAGTVTHIERSILRLVPELSIMPAEMPK